MPTETDAPEKLKILYVITKSNFGGAQRYVYDLARAARNAGQDVVVAFGGEGALATKLRSAGIRTVSLPSLGRDLSLRADLRSFLDLCKLIWAESPDIVHLNSSKVGALGALAARLFNLAALVLGLFGRARRRVATLFTGHGWAFNEERSWPSRLAIGIAHWLTIQLSHCIIAVSEATRRQVLSLPFVRKKLVTVHNGVAAIALEDPEAAWRRIVACTPWEHRYPLKPPLAVGTLSELHNNKGLSYAIDAMAQVRQEAGARLVFVILGEGEQRDALAEQVRRLRLEDSVLLAGFRSDACELLRALDIFLLSSVTEAFPYALLEAASAGLPIVATRVGGVPDLVEDRVSGLLIQPRSSAAIAAAVRSLIEHPEERARMARKIQARVVETFSLGDMTARTFALYDSVRGRLALGADRHPADKPDVLGRTG